MTLVLEPTDDTLRSEAARLIVETLAARGQPKRCWAEALFDALRALHPAAAVHLFSYDDPRSTLGLFWPDAL